MLEKIKTMAERFKEVEQLLSKPETLSQPSLYKKYLKEHGSLKRIAGKYFEFFEIESALKEAEEIIAANEDEELVELATEEVAEHTAAREKLLAELQDLLVSEDEDDNKDVIVDIQAGTGGDEAGLFVGDLLRLYERLADRRGWKTEVLNHAAANAGGFKYVTVAISGDFVHRELKFESGGHRVQRVPETESQGRIHTSLATVVVMPEIEEVEIEIPDEEIEVQTFCASGPGGQHVNKTESAVRLIHKPTGIKVECQDEKSQHMNRTKARRILISRVADHYRDIQAQEIGDKRRSLRGSGDRSQRVRTYNFPQNRLSDHRINLTQYNLDKVMEGDLDSVIEALQADDKAQKLAEMGSPAG